MLRTTVCRERARFQSSDHPDWRLSVRWHAELKRRDFSPTGYIDLAQESGTRVWDADRAAGYALMFQTHPACAEALGRPRVREELRVAYDWALNAAENHTAASALNSVAFEQRGTSGMTRGRSVCAAFGSF